MIDVNLLPAEIKDSVSQAKSNKRALAYFKRSCFFTFAVVFIAVAAHFYFLSVLEQSKRQLKAAEAAVQEFSQIEAQAQSLTQKLSKIKKIDDSRFIWSNVLTEIDNITPANVRVISLKLDSVQKNRASVNGRAPSKKDVADYRDILEKSNYFEYVDIESTQNNGDSESYNITFSLSKDALENE